MGLIQSSFPQFLVLPVILLHSFTDCTRLLKAGNPSLQEAETGEGPLGIKLA